MCIIDYILISLIIFSSVAIGLALFYYRNKQTEISNSVIVTID